MFRQTMKTLIAATAILFVGTSVRSDATQYRRAGAAAPHASAAAPYPEFRAPGGQTVHWLAEQMPLKVYVSHGLSLDSVVDPQLGAPMTNVDNKERWPDLVADIVQNPQTMQSLTVAEGFVPAHFDAAVQGISSWKAFQRDGISFTFTDDPSDADIYVFWTKQFVNKLGLALFENDIRGYTAKRSFPLSAIQQGKHIEFRPVVTLLRTTDSAGNPMPLGWMKASATHEFGHALGIEQHSRNPNDLMSVYYGHGVISANDAATIRYLYRIRPDFVP